MAAADVVENGVNHVAPGLARNGSKGKLRIAHCYGRLGLAQNFAGHGVQRTNSLSGHTSGKHRLI
jgi:hypothetical protein